MFQQIIGILFVLNVATAAAPEASFSNDNMANFLAVVANAQAVAKPAASPADAADLSHNVAATNFADAALIRQHGTRHLGLGFAHGMGKGSAEAQKIECRGNGHAGYPDRSGNADSGGAGFARGDCGEPSPSD